MRRIVFTLVVILGLYSLDVSAQVDVSGLDFRLKSSVMRVGEEKIAINSRIVREGDRLLWRQRSFSRVQDQVFRIRSSSGSWNKETGEGKITLQLRSGGESYRFVLVRTPEGVRGRLFYISRQSGKEDKHVFFIDRIRYGRKASTQS